MSNNYKYLVVDPGLSYVAFSQPLTAAYYAQAHEDCSMPQYPIHVIPYSPFAHLLLRVQKKLYYSKHRFKFLRNFKPFIPQYLQAQVQ